MIINWPAILFIACCLSCKTRQTIAPKAQPISLADLREKYTVTGIDSIKNVYVIYARSVSGQYQIVSLKDSIPCTPIQVGSSYPFVLTSIVPKTMNGMNLTTAFLHVSGTSFHGVTIPFEPGYNKDLFVAMNLKGLCL